MQQIVMILGICLIALTTSGCCPKCPTIPQKCVVPYVEKPIITNIKFEDSFDGAKQALRNYYKTKEYSEKLEAAIKVCQ